MTRREWLAFTGASAFAAAARKPPTLSVEVYIWLQHLQNGKQTLAEGMDTIFPEARAAGFRNIELNADFFSPELAPRTLALLKANRLSMPSVYVGGVMHETAAADDTIRRALDVAGRAKAAGLQAVVNNPNPKKNREPKTDDELRLQGERLNRLGRELSSRGLQFWVHHHDPEMAGNAHEWRHILRNTDYKTVSLCLDLDWVHQGGQDPLALLKEAGSRVAALHLRNSRNKLWLESFEDGDIDYRKVAAYLEQAALSPLLVVELAYRKETSVTRSLKDNLIRSRRYAERIFHAAP